jgi:histidine triad (HIT) family protein
MPEPEITPEQRAAFEEKLKNMSPEELAQFQKQQCIFCQIISGKIPSKSIYQDEHCTAILDINPAVKGHVLLIPKEHYAIMPQVPDFIIEHLFVVAKKLSQALLRGLKSSGTNIFIANGQAAGQKSQHFMLHILPRKEGDQLLNLDETLIDKELQQNIVVTVGNKLNEILGIKKEKVPVQKTLTDEPEPEVKESKEPLEETQEPEEKVEVSNHSEEEHTSEEPESEEPEVEKKEDIFAPKEEPEEKDDEDVSLDDIANLFK